MPTDRRILNQPINHHYLPIFYLKQWCDGDGKVVRYYRPYREVVASTIIPENTGYEPNLYALGGFPADLRASIEASYMGPVIDAKASDALKLLLAGRLTTMNDANKRAWARFLASLALRNPETLAAVNAEMRQLLIAQLCAKPDAQEAYRTSSDPRDIGAWFEDQYPAILERAGTLQLPLFITELSKPFHEMLWSLCDLSTSPTSLLTSDRPLFGQHGSGDPRYIVALPLSPRFLFVAANANESIQELASQPPDTVISMINRQLVTQAATHVYGSTKSHLAVIERHLRPKH
jgi:Protein of unknown function (DUF4238)